MKNASRSLSADSGRRRAIKMNILFLFGILDILSIISDVLSAEEVLCAYLGIWHIQTIFDPSH